LQLQDFDVTAVADGGAALDALRANYEARPAGDTSLAPLDLAMLDMSMPVRTCELYAQWYNRCCADAA
jgi:hypothetical protein